MKISHEAMKGIAKLAAEGRVTGARPTKAPAVLPSGWSITLLLPCKVVSEANRRDHWDARRRRFEEQRSALLAALIAAPVVGHPLRGYLPLRVTFTREGQAMDSNNLAGAFKGLRDALAQWIGVDDGDARLTWVYAQRPGKGGVEVRIEPADALVREGA